MSRARVPTRTGKRLALAAVQSGTFAALVVDGVVHLRDAGYYAPSHGTLISEATLFRAQAVVALVVAALVLVWPRRLIWLAALAVAASAFGAVVLCTYVDLGPIAGLPDLYEPTWGPPGKVASAYAEGAGTVLALTGVLLTWKRRPPSRLGRRSLTRATLTG